MTVLSVACGQSPQSDPAAASGSVQSPPGAPPADGQGQMSLDDMINSIREDCRAPLAAVDDLRGTVSRARASDDVRTMRSALRVAEESLTEMHKRVGMCVNTVEVMRQTEWGAVR